MEPKIVTGYKIEKALFAPLLNACFLFSSGSSSGNLSPCGNWSHRPCAGNV